jgi:hypothetical protein
MADCFTNVADDNVLAHLDRHGFLERPRSRSSELASLWSLILRLRPQNIRCDRLRPRDPLTARSNTLSSNHGTGAFPPHTDFALQSLPPHYIALFCPIARPGGTTLFSGSRLRQTSPSGTFRIKTRTRSFSSTFSNISRFGNFYRYNADLMSPLDSNARNQAEAILLAEPDHIVYWDKISWVIIDNWATLHGREPAPEKIGWLWRVAWDVQS